MRHDNYITPDKIYKQLVEHKFKFSRKIAIKVASLTKHYKVSNTSARLEMSSTNNGCLFRHFSLRNKTKNTHWLCLISRLVNWWIKYSSWQISNSWFL